MKEMARTVNKDGHRHCRKWPRLPCREHSSTTLFLGIPRKMMLAREGGSKVPGRPEHSICTAPQFCRLPREKNVSDVWWTLGAAMLGLLLVLFLTLGTTATHSRKWLRYVQRPHSGQTRASTLLHWPCTS